MFQAEVFDYRGTTFQKALLTRQSLKVGTASMDMSANVTGRVVEKHVRDQIASM